MSFNTTLGRKTVRTIVKVEMTITISVAATKPAERNCPDNAVPSISEHQLQRDLCKVRITHFVGFHITELIWGSKEAQHLIDVPHKHLTVDCFYCSMSHLCQSQTNDLLEKDPKRRRHVTKGARVNCKKDKGHSFIFYTCCIQWIIASLIHTITSHVAI